MNKVNKKKIKHEPVEWSDGVFRCKNCGKIVDIDNGDFGNCDYDREHCKHEIAQDENGEKFCYKCGIKAYEG